MHIGNYIRDVIKEKRYSVSEIADLVSKSETSVRKDFEKSNLHMGALEAYAEALSINLYEILADVWKTVHEGGEIKPYEETDLVNKAMANESQGGIFSSKKTCPILLDRCGMKFNFHSDFQNQQAYWGRHPQSIISFGGILLGPADC